MSSQKGEDEYITFAGKSAEEAEDFIHAVNRRAWAAGKLNDHAWMANFAYVCFTKKALRWYEELDEQTRSDWRLLRSAILAKYTTPPQSPSIVPSSAPAAASPPGSVHHTPIAVAPTATTVRQGRIRIDQGNGINAYVAHEASGTDETPCDHTESVFDACVFKFDTISRMIAFPDGESLLTVRANLEGWTLEPNKAVGSRVEYGALARSFPNSQPYWQGAKWDDIWSLSPDGKMVASLKPLDGSLFNLEVTLFRGNSGPIYLTSDINAFTNSYGSQHYQAVTLYFEPFP